MWLVETKCGKRAEAAQRTQRCSAEAGTEQTAQGLSFDRHVQQPETHAISEGPNHSDVYGYDLHIMCLTGEQNTRPPPGSREASLSGHRPGQLSPVVHAIRPWPLETTTASQSSRRLPKLPFRYRYEDSSTLLQALNESSLIAWLPTLTALHHKVKGRTQKSGWHYQQRARVGKIKKAVVWAFWAQGCWMRLFP